MPGISDFLETSLLNHLMKNAAYTRPANIYVSLSRADPTDSGAAIDEPPGTENYARQLVTPWELFASGNRGATNTGIVTFPAAGTAGWGNITHFGLHDALTGGNFLAGGALDQPVAVPDGVIVSFQAQQIEVQLNTSSPGGLTDAAAQKLMSHVFGIGAPFGQLANLAVALCTAPTGDDDDGTTIVEPVGNGYSRVTFNDWDDAVSSAVDNATTISMGPASGGNWGTITHWAILDAANNDLYWHGPVATAGGKPVNDGSPVEWQPGALVVNLR